MMYLGQPLGGHVQNLYTSDGWTFEELGHLRVRVSRGNEQAIVVGVPFSLLL